MSSKDRSTKEQLKNRFMVMMEVLSSSLMIACKTRKDREFYLSYLYGATECFLDLYDENFKWDLVCRGDEVKKKEGEQTLPFSNLMGTSPTKLSKIKCEDCGVEYLNIGMETCPMCKDEEVFGEMHAELDFIVDELKGGN